MVLPVELPSVTSAEGVHATKNKTVNKANNDLIDLPAQMPSYQLYRQMRGKSEKDYGLICLILRDLPKIDLNHFQLKDGEKVPRSL